MTHYRVTIHLASGAQLTAVLDSPEDTGIEDIVDELHDLLEGEGENHRRPGWREVGNVLAFSQAISAVQVDTYNGGNPQ